MTSSVSDPDHLESEKTRDSAPGESSGEPDRPKLQLVSEADASEEVEPDLSVDRAVRRGVFPELKAKLESEGFEVNDAGFGLTFLLPAGRSQREVRIAPGVSEAALEVDFRGWRSLLRFDGVWHPGRNLIEVALRGDRTTPLLRILDRLSPHRGERGNEPEPITLRDEVAGIGLTLGRSTPLMAIVCGVRYPGGMYGRQAQRVLSGPLTLTLDHARVSNVNEADDLVERVTDSLAVEVGMKLGVPLVPLALKNREPRPVRSRRLSGPLGFPRNSYPHAPVVLYVAGRERTTSALIRYWAYYQVLEYFFPFYTQSESLQRMQRILRAPTFDPHRDEDVLRAVAAANDLGSSRVGEEEQLVTCLRAITTSSEVRALIQDLGLSEALSQKKGHASAVTLNLQSASSDVLTDLAKRIYDIRCRIVHSKAESQRESGHGLLPGTEHEALVEAELPILEFLAEQALVGSATRFSIPHAQGAVSGESDTLLNN